MARDFKGVKVAPSADTTTGLPSGHLMFLIGGDYDVNAMVVSEVTPVFLFFSKSPKTHLGLPCIVLYF